MEKLVYVKQEWERKRFNIMWIERIVTQMMVFYILQLIILLLLTWKWYDGQPQEPAFYPLQVNNQY